MTVNVLSLFVYLNIFSELENKQTISVTFLQLDHVTWLPDKASAVWGPLWVTAEPDFTLKNFLILDQK